ncbi:MAG: hypothetical protein HWQ38_07880 [Nostoc sp. NMS7]|uniref:hypothetical protein n=1 Tax=Nostoc sp. NMS7 TaxID=2815391 RepID=UPI0025EAC2A9|nr:hypothetical protein [Nostoc sp. NMS7]MBN3946401.1 hypothetical protein [Nostoc sp. NMS7]
MPNFYSNIKTRLNKQGYKSTKDEILNAANYLGVIDIENANSEQILEGVDYLITQQSTKLQIIEEMLPTLTHHQEPETITQEEIENDGMQTIAPLEEDTNESAIALDENDYSDADKRALTVQKSQELGITLSDTEINLIADSIEQCTQSLDELLDGIQSALVAYINHKTSQNTKKIDSALDAVVDYAEQKFSDNSQHLSNRLIKLGSEMEAVATRNKSQIKSILSRLAVPSP